MGYLIISLYLTNAIAVGLAVYGIVTNKSAERVNTKWLIAIWALLSMHIMGGH